MAHSRSRDSPIVGQSRRSGVPRRSNDAQGYYHPARLDGRRSRSLMALDPDKTLDSIDAIVESVEEFGSVDDLLVYAQKLSRLSVLWHQPRHHQYVSQLKRVINSMEYTQRKIKDGASYKVAVLLYELEKELTSSCGLSAQLMKLLAHEINAHIGLVPSTHDMKEVGKALESLPSKTYKTTSFQDWGAHALFPLRKSLKQHHDTFESAQEQDDFTSLADASVREALYLNDERLKTSIPIHWFRQALKHALDNGRYGFLDNAAMLAEVYDDNFLHWTSLGSVMEQLLQRGAVLEQDCHAEILEHRKFREIATVVLPTFLDKLSTLLTMLQGQTQEVEDLKAKLLALSVSAFVATVPILVRMYMLPSKIGCESIPFLEHPNKTWL